MHFQVKNILKNNHKYTFKHYTLKNIYKTQLKKYIKTIP